MARTIDPRPRYATKAGMAVTPEGYAVQLYRAWAAVQCHVCAVWIAPGVLFRRTLLHRRGEGTLPTTEPLCRRCAPFDGPAF